MTMLYSVLLLVMLGVFAALILYFVSKKFYVYEDPLIEQVEDVLPAANCAGCGFPGCKAFAENLVQSEDISELFCPVGGNDTMKAVADILGKEVSEQAPTVAVVRCQGGCDVRPKTSEFQGPLSCSISTLLYGGETDCEYGCLGMGECVDACDFDAMFMDEKTGLPVVITDKCTSCGACVKACPKDIIEMRPKKKRDLKIFVSCMNQDKGGIARKACSVACIGCNKCFDICPKDAITMENMLAYIDPDLCTLCRKCVPICPTDSILETNFPPPKVKKEDAKKPAKKVKKVAKEKSDDVVVTKVKPTVKKEPKEAVEKMEATVQSVTSEKIENNA